MKWDLFVSHASEDKNAVAEPLVKALEKAEISVWYDRIVLQLGDSLRRCIDEGLANSQFGIVILSPSFFAKEWPQRELDGLVQREENGQKVILPIWYDITPAEVRQYSPMVADRVAAMWSDGLESVVKKIVATVRANRSVESPPAARSQVATPRVSAGQQTPNALPALQHRIEVALQQAGLSGKPSFSLGAIPTGETDIPQLVESQQSEVVRLLEKPPQLRRGGFDLDTGERALLQDAGRLRRSSASGWKSLELWRDGTLIFVATGGPEFLCRDIDETAGAPLSVNPLVLAESTYLFCELVQRIHAHAVPQPTEIQYALELRRLDQGGQNPTLNPEEVREISLPRLSPPPRAPYGGERFGQECNSSLAADAVAFKLVGDVYLWFGIEWDQIPYATQKDGFRVIDTECIRR